MCVAVSAAHGAQGMCNGATPTRKWLLSDLTSAGDTTCRAAIHAYCCDTESYLLVRHPGFQKLCLFHPFCPSPSQSPTHPPIPRQSLSLTHNHSALPGETTAIGCLPQPSQLGPDVHPGGRWGAMQNELVSQIFTGPPQMVLVSTAGVLELERRRPVDVLQELLQVRGHRCQ